MHLAISNLCNSMEAATNAAEAHIEIPSSILYFYIQRIHHRNYSHFLYYSSAGALMSQEVLYFIHRVYLRNLIVFCKSSA